MLSFAYGLVSGLLSSDVVNPVHLSKQLNLSEENQNYQINPHQEKAERCNYKMRIELVLLKNVCEKYLIVLAISMPDGGGRTLCNNRI